MRKKILGKGAGSIDAGPTHDDLEFSLDDNDKPKQKTKKATGAKARKAQKKAADPSDSRINFVKTNNKLIGEIENNDLYNSDDGILDQDRTMVNNELRNEQLDLDFGLPPNKENEVAKPANKFLMKLKEKNKATEGT